jgi:hypothetical protein
MRLTPFAAAVIACAVAVITIGTTWAVVNALHDLPAYTVAMLIIGPMALYEAVIWAVNLLLAANPSAAASRATTGDGQHQAANPTA